MNCFFNILHKRFVHTHLIIAYKLRKAVPVYIHLWNQCSLLLNLSFLDLLLCVEPTLALVAAAENPQGHSGKRAVW